MKKQLLFVFMLLFSSSLLFSQVAINADGSDPNNSAMLDVKSANKGFLPPRMTLAAINAITNPADGLIVYCTNCGGTNGLGALSMFMAGEWFILSANRIKPLPPQPGTSTASLTQIVWNWNLVTDAIGYKWNTTNNYLTAFNMGTASIKTETGLVCSTAYTRYVWAYSSCGNSTPTSLSQITSDCLFPPIVTTTAVTAIAQNTATSGGSATSGGGINVTVRGVCWSTSENPTTASAKTTDGAWSGSYSSAITGLTANTLYHIRAYATNSVGTSYGNDITFTTLVNAVPTVSTTAVTAITATTATSSGNVTSDGGVTVTARGVCWSTSANPTTATSTTTNGSGVGSFSSNLTGLTPNTLYHIRAYSTNSLGTSYGSDITFTTSKVVPTVSTIAPSDITATTATSGGIVTNDGDATVTARGVCWSTSSYPVATINSTTSDGTGVGSFTSNLTGLTENTRYYLRAYSTNSVGTGYGEMVMFITPRPIIFNPNLTYGTITDIDGNVYKTITIGTQTWMAENLKTTKYRNGDAIPNITDDAAWGLLTTGAYCWYNNDATNKSTYGGLYNWYAVADSRNIAPIGWHVPTDAEWTTLTNSLNGVLAATGKMKETGITHWESNQNYGATNESGFTALPGNYRNRELFSAVGYESGYWWSTTEASADYAWERDLERINTEVHRGNLSKYFGLSVRCVKDLPVVTVPTVSTLVPSDITSTTATSGGNVSSDGGATVTARGVCWSTSANPTIVTNTTTDGSSIGSFSSNLTGLTANTTYYVRAYATNSAGTGYGNEVSFKTLNPIIFNPNLTYGTMTDIDGNDYKTITIGTQTWMAENLKTTKYRNGNLIQNVTDGTAWAALNTGAYCWYNNDAANKPTNGGLYNWYAIADSRNIAPIGWHVPTDAEWTTLTTFLGGESVAGGKMKEAGTMHWLSPNTASTNSSGLTVISYGYRTSSNGSFGYLGNGGYYWSSTQLDVAIAWYRYLYYDYAGCYRYGNFKQNGFSVRCIRD